MSKIRGMGCALLLGLFLCSGVVYMLFTAGVVDDVFIAPGYEARAVWIEEAGRADPPDVEFLLASLTGPDWMSSALAAEELGRLQQSGKLTPQQAEQAGHVLRRLLDSGHWWRFGWDEDEPDFGQFQGAALETLEVLP